MPELTTAPGLPHHPGFQVNTFSDFMFTPLIGGVIDAYGRTAAVQMATLTDAATFLLLGLRPSLGSYFLWQIMREFSRRANKPARCVTRNPRTPNQHTSSYKNTHAGMLIWCPG